MERSVEVSGWVGARREEKRVVKVV